jgi:hypothetical protein
MTIRLQLANVGLGYEPCPADGTKSHAETKAAGPPETSKRLFASLAPIANV